MPHIFVGLDGAGPSGDQTRRGPVRSGHRMQGYRLYYLDRHGHIIGRDEFFADDDAAALVKAIGLHEKSERAHSGLMLWQSVRQVFVTDDANSLALAKLETP
jgi:hypothetical protein